MIIQFGILQNSEELHMHMKAFDSCKIQVSKQKIRLLCSCFVILRKVKIKKGGEHHGKKER